MTAERDVEEAIRAAIAETNPGWMVTGYVIVVESTDGQDRTALTYDAAPGQGVAQTLGLLDLGKRHHLTRIGDATDDD